MRRPHPAQIGGAMLVCALLALAGALWLTRSNESDSPLVERPSAESANNHSPLGPGEPLTGTRSSAARQAATAGGPAPAAERVVAPVSGVTLGPGGAPLVGARVVLSAVDAKGGVLQLVTASGPGGSFSLELPPGASAHHVRSTAGELGAFVVLAGSDRLADLVLRHQRLREIRAFVLDDRSAPVEGVRLIAHPAPEAELLEALACEPITVTTDHTGGARVEVPWSVPTALHAESATHGVARAVIGIRTESCVLKLERSKLHPLASPAPFIPDDLAAAVEVVSFGEHEAGNGDGLPCMLPLATFASGLVVETPGAASGVLQALLTGTPVLGLCPAAGEDPVAFCTFDPARGAYGPWRKLEETRLSLTGAVHKEGKATVRTTHEGQGLTFSIDSDARLTGEGEWAVDTGHVGLGGSAKVELEVTGTERTRFVGTVDLEPGLHPVVLAPSPSRLVPVIVTVKAEETDRPLVDRTISVTETGGSNKPWHTDRVTDEQGQFSFWGDPERGYEFRTAPAPSAREFVSKMNLADADCTTDGCFAVTLSVPTALCRVTLRLGDVEGPHRFAVANLDRAPNQTDLRLECTASSCQRAAWEELALVVDAEQGSVEARLPIGRYAAYLVPLTVGSRVIDIRLPEMASSRSYRATEFEIRGEERLSVQLARALGPLGAGTPQAYIEVPGLMDLVSSEQWTYELWAGALGASGSVQASQPMNPDQYRVTGDTIAVACDSKLFALLQLEAEGGFAQSIPLCLQPSLPERVDLGHTVTIRSAAGSAAPIADLLTCQVGTSRTSQSGDVLRGYQRSQCSIRGVDLAAGYVLRGVAPGSSLNITIETDEGTYRGASAGTSKRQVDSQCVLSLFPR